MEAMKRCVFHIIVLAALVLRRGETTGHPCDPVHIDAWAADDIQLSSSVEFSITVKDIESCHKGRPNCYTMEFIPCGRQEVDFVSFGPQYHAKKCIINPGCVSMRCGSVQSPQVSGLPGILPQLDVACKAFRNSSVFSVEMESDERALGWTVYLLGVNHTRVHGVGKAKSIPGKPNTVWVYGNFKWDKCYDIQYAPMLETEDTDCNRVRHYDQICYNETTVAANLPPFCLDGPNSPKKIPRTRIHRPSTRITPGRGTNQRTQYNTGTIVTTPDSQKPVIIHRTVPVYSSRARLPIIFGHTRNKPSPPSEYIAQPMTSSLRSSVLDLESDMSRSLSSVWSSNTNSDLSSPIPSETALLPTSYTLIHRTTINGKPIEKPSEGKYEEPVKKPGKGKSVEESSRTNRIIDKELIDKMVDPEKYKIFSKKRMIAPTPSSTAVKLCITTYSLLTIPLLLQWAVN